MRPVAKLFAFLVGIVVLVGIGVVVYVMNAGVSAREQPGRIETFLAHRVRTLAIGGRSRNLRNPVDRTPEIVAEGRAHFADHCATCHANDGSGSTAMGRGMWPKVPDIRLAATQDLSDGELFWIIENGIRFTGMAGWGDGTRESEEASWHLVHFIRHLPDLSGPELEEMEGLNPKSPDEIREQIEQEEFLKGGGDPRPETSPSPQTHHHGG